MAANQAVLSRLRLLGPIFRARNAVEAGVSWRDLYRARDNGQILELSRGLYRLGEAGNLDWLDFVVACARAPRAMVCLGSALSYWDLSDEIPGWVDLAIPEGLHRPRINYPPTKVHVFQSETFDLGRIEVEAGPGTLFAITDPERTVVDAFRTRHRLGEDLAVGGMKRYLRRSRSKPGRVLELARELRVSTPILNALQLLQD